LNLSLVAQTLSLKQHQKLVRLAFDPSDRARVARAGFINYFCDRYWQSYLQAKQKQKKQTKKRKLHEIS
jgi:hypothetical protein